MPLAVAAWAMLVIVGSARQPAGHAFTREAGFPHWTLGRLLSGRSRVRLDGATVDVRGGDFVLVRPRTTYALDMPEGGEEAWAMFTPPPAWAELLAWPEAAPGFAVIPGGGAHAAAAQASFGEAQVWWAGGSPRRAALALNAIERCLLLSALDRPGEAWADLHPGVRLALAYLAPGPAEKITVGSLARRVGMSPSHLAHRFTVQVGEAPLAWLEGRRIANAQQALLTTDLPVKRIAQNCGFADGEHFARRFRARTGSSPLAWRSRPTMA